MSLKAAFGLILQLHGRKMTISRPGTGSTGLVKVSSGNYFRNMSGPDDVTIEGREFVISKASLDAISFPTLKKGDRLLDGELGVSVISEVREMFDFGGGIMGYRVRCS